MSPYKVSLLVALFILSLALCIEQYINYGVFWEVADVLHHETPGIIFTALLVVFILEWLYSGDP